MRKNLWNVHNIGGAHLQYVNNHKAKFEWKGMKTYCVTDYTNLAPLKCCGLWIQKTIVPPKRHCVITKRPSAQRNRWRWKYRYAQVWRCPQQQGFTSKVVGIKWQHCFFRQTWCFCYCWPNSYLHSKTLSDRVMYLPNKKELYPHSWS